MDLLPDDFHISATPSPASSPRSISTLSLDPSPASPLQDDVVFLSLSPSRTPPPPDDDMDDGEELQLVLEYSEAASQELEAMQGSQTTQSVDISFYTSPVPMASESQIELSAPDAIYSPHSLNLPASPSPPPPPLRRPPPLLLPPAVLPLPLPRPRWPPVTQASVDLNEWPCLSLPIRHGEDPSLTRLLHGRSRLSSAFRDFCKPVSLNAEAEAHIEAHPELYCWQIKWDGNRVFWDGYEGVAYSKSLRICVKPPSMWIDRMPKDVYLDGEFFIHHPDAIACTGTAYLGNLAEVSTVWRYGKQSQTPANRLLIENMPLWKRMMFRAWDIVNAPVVRLPLRVRAKALVGIYNVDRIRSWQPGYDQSSFRLEMDFGVFQIQRFYLFKPSESALAQIGHIMGLLGMVGGEGIVLKRLDLAYGKGKWFKKKLWQDAEYTVVQWSGASWKLRSAQGEIVSVYRVANGLRITRGNAVVVQYLSKGERGQLRDAFIKAIVH